MIFWIVSMTKSFFEKDEDTILKRESKNLPQKLYIPVSPQYPMTQKIKAQILEGKVSWIKEGDTSPRLEGEISIEFQCSECHGTNKIKQNITNYDGTDEVYKCRLCEEEYLINLEIRNPITPTIGDKEDVKMYRQMIPTLQKVRGVSPHDQTNLE